MNEITVDEIIIQIIQKQIRTLRLSVLPPHGVVRISAPYRMEIDTIRQFAHSKLDWIRKHQTKMRSMPWKEPLRYCSGEKHLFLGKEYLLEVVVNKGKAKVNTERMLENESLIVLDVPPQTSRKKKQEVLEEWYRLQLKEVIPHIAKKHEEVMNVHADEWRIKKMKTKWGTCNITKKKVTLNLELAKHPLSFIEHVIVHELVHLMERKHNARFKILMDQYLPGWRGVKKEQ